jgi:aryl-alcohol dehydrogenase-like predicted oxidoreductase
MAILDHAAQQRTSWLDELEIGVGTWAWGDRLMWNYGSNYAEQDLRDAYAESLSARITLFDTAEIYGFGGSERFLGRFMRETGTRPRLATKFFPYPWRQLGSQLINALRGSLQRLGVPSVDLYQLHVPTPPFTVERWADALAEAVDLGLTAAVGVSNYSADDVRRMVDALARRGVTLASNQVEYSLIHRDIEFDGTLRACRELGVRVIAYSPIGMGLLTGKYTPANPPGGARRFKLGGMVDGVQPLVSLLREVGQRYGKTPAQVAINWTLCKGTLPIPGAKTARQALMNAGGANWRLNDEDIAALDEESARDVR